MSNVGRTLRVKCCSETKRGTAQWVKITQKVSSFNLVKKTRLGFLVARFARKNETILGSFQTMWARCKLR